MYGSGTGALVWAGPITNTATGGNTLSIGGTNTGTNELRGVLADNGANVLSVSKLDAGKWILSGSNTFTGTTTVNAGTLIVKNSNALGATNGATTVANVSTALLQFDGSAGDLTVPEPITIQGAQSGSLRNLSGTNTLSGAVTLTSGADFRMTSGRLIFAGGITSANNSGFSLNGEFTIGTTPVTIGTGGMGFTSNGNNPATPARLNIGGNTWGATTINFGGYVTLGAHDALPTNTTVQWGWSAPDQSSGTLDLNGYNQTVAALKAHPSNPTVYGDQKITGSSGTFTINQDSGTNTWFGRFEGGISVVKSGAGMLVVSGTNTSSDATSVSVLGGGVSLTHTSVLSTNTTVYITTGATVELSAGTHVIQNLYINGIRQRKALLNASNLPGVISGTGSFFPRMGWSGTLIRVL